MNIRLADHKDVDKLIRLRFDYFASENWELTSEKKELIASQLRKYYLKHLNTDFFAAFVEDDTGDILSTAFLVISEKPGNLSWPTGKTGLILNVFTYSEHRKKGYATKALNLLIELAKEQGTSFIELSASPLGKPLYEKLGFQEQKPSNFKKMKMSFHT